MTILCQSVQLNGVMVMTGQCRFSIKWMAIHEMMVADTLVIVIVVCWNSSKKKVAPIYRIPIATVLQL